MATAEPQHEVVKTLKGVTLTMSTQEAASLVHLLCFGAGGTANSAKGDIGKIIMALKMAFGKDRYDMIDDLVEQYSGITVCEDHDYGHVIADIRKR